MLGLITLIQIPILAMTFAGAQLDDLVQSCAANVGPSTMKAIISVESSGDSLAIDDDTNRRSYSPKNLAQAQAIAAMMTKQGHNFDAGIAQVNSQNFAREGMDLGNMFDPCTNLRAGARILGRSYQAAAQWLWIGHAPRSIEDQRTQEQLALRHAFSIYNSGSAWKSMHYSDLVVAAGLREMAYRQPSIRVPALTLFPSEIGTYSSVRRNATNSLATDSVYQDAGSFREGMLPQARPQPPPKPKPKKPDLKTLANTSDLSPKDL